MHVKSLIFDEKILLTGSVNMTHNGFENNKEHLYRVAEPSAVADVLADFEKEWAGAEQVTPPLIELMLANFQKRNDEAKENRERSVPRKAGRGIVRSLSLELERVQEEPASGKANR